MPLDRGASLATFPQEAARMTVNARRVDHQPDPADLRAWTERQVNARLTEFGNVVVRTEVTARSTGETMIVSDRPERHSGPVLAPEDYQTVAAAQERYLADQEVVVLDGYIGDHPDGRMGARLIVEKSHAGLAAMQQLLYFPADPGFEPELTIVYTPRLPAAGYPNERLVAVDLEGGVTRVLNSDYFGDSKMSGIRMWDAAMYRRGGLAFHSGLKVIETGAGTKVAMIVGLSGTGKTTTTFSVPDTSRPSQDDFVAILPDGHVYGTEAGTFAKVYGLTPESEPAIWPGATHPSSYLENVAVSPSGQVDFSDRTHTENTRAIIGGRLLPGFLPPRQVESPDFLLLLTRNTNVIPAVSKLDHPRAAAAFMLGETQGTSAGGAAEAGRFLRIPGTNPFFAYRNEWQANRFFELLHRVPLEVYLVNTGRVGGVEADERSKNLVPAHTAAILLAIARGTIEWVSDPDFGTLVAERVDGIDDPELLQPRLLYQRQGRGDEHRDLVEALRADRRAYLAGFPELLPEIVQAV